MVSKFFFRHCQAKWKNLDVFFSLLKFHWAKANEKFLEDFNKNKLISVASFCNWYFEKSKATFFIWGFDFLEGLPTFTCQALKKLLEVYAKKRATKPSNLQCIKL